MRCLLDPLINIDWPTLIADESQFMNKYDDIAVPWVSLADKLCNKANDTDIQASPNK